MSKIAIGIDIGGTKISAAAVENCTIKGEVLTFKTPKTSIEILETIIKAIELLAAQYSVKAIGIASAGTANLENSRIIGSTGNLPSGYSELEFKKIIEEKFRIKTFVENDANAAAYAEYSCGAAKGHQNTITITLGTGIGGGIIVEGKLLRGKSGVASEVGHMQLSWRKERQCTCGEWDCWEAYASGTGYALNAQEMAQELPAFQTSILKDKPAQELTTYDIISGLKKDDFFCRKVHERWENFVIMGLVSLINIFDPESIVLSGGMAQFIDFEKIEKTLNKRSVISQIKLLHAQHENNAGILGSAILALENNQ